jgi:nucleotide-binding universal stress UspA family protein
MVEAHAAVESAARQAQPSRVADILLAYDGSQHAQAAVELLRGLPLNPESHITALAVMPTQQIGGHEALQAALERIKPALAESGAQVQIELKAGNPAASINAWSDEHQVNLIVVGAKGLRSTLGILLGGVAQQVVEYSCCPVLIVRAPFHGLERILLVLDGSQPGQKALEYLQRSFDFWSAIAQHPPEVTIMHVLPPSLPPDIALRSWTVGPEALYPIPEKPIDLEALEAEEAANGEALLAKAAETLASALPLVNEMVYTPRTLLKRGDAATEIIDYARQHDVDLIVSGSRGLNPVSGWLLGSVSRKLVHYAGCSVLVVK